MGSGSGSGGKRVQCGLESGVGEIHEAQKSWPKYWNHCKLSSIRDDHDGDYNGMCINLTCILYNS